MQLANFIAIQPMQNILIQLRGMVVKNNLAFGYADNPRAVFSHQLHRMQVYHHADALFANFAQDMSLVREDRDGLTSGVPVGYQTHGRVAKSGRDKR